MVQYIYEDVNANAYLVYMAKLSIKGDIHDGGGDRVSVCHSADCHTAKGCHNLFI